MFQYYRWLDLPMQTRLKLAEVFNIPKRGSTEVFNNSIKSDGFLIKDIEENLSFEKIQNFIEDTSEEDAIKLWNKMLNKINGVESKVKEPLPTIPEENIILQPKLKTKSSKKNGQ